MKDAAARLGLDRGKIRAVVDAHGYGQVVGEVRADVVTGGAQGRQDVGQVVLALGVVVGETGEGRCKWPRLEDVGPGIDLANCQLLSGGVAGRLGLDHSFHPALAVADDPPVGAGIIELDRQHCRRRTGGGMRPEQPSDRLGRNQRHVPGEDERRLGFFDQGQCGPNRSPGAIGLGLDNGLDSLRKPSSYFLAGRDDDSHPSRPRFLRSDDRPRHHLPPTDGVQHLRQAGTHARSLPGGHDQDERRTHPRIVVGGGVMCPSSRGSATTVRIFPRDLLRNGL